MRKIPGAAPELCSVMNFNDTREEINPQNQVTVDNPEGESTGSELELSNPGSDSEIGSDEIERSASPQVNQVYQENGKEFFVGYDGEMPWWCEDPESLIYEHVRVEDGDRTRDGTVTDYNEGMHRIDWDDKNLDWCELTSKTFCKISDSGESENLWYETNKYTVQVEYDPFPVMMRNAKRDAPTQVCHEGSKPKTQVFSSSDRYEQQETQVIPQQETFQSSKPQEAIENTSHKHMGEEITNCVLRGTETSETAQQKQQKRQSNVVDEITEDHGNHYGDPGGERDATPKNFERSNQEADDRMNDELNDVDGNAQWFQLYRMMLKDHPDIELRGIEIDSEGKEVMQAWNDYGVYKKNHPDGSSQSDSGGLKDDDKDPINDMCDIMTCPELQLNQ